MKIPLQPVRKFGIRNSEFGIACPPGGPRFRTPRSALRIGNNRQSEIANPKSAAAFTLIELLVVMSIIAILTALILATAGYASSKARRAAVETERETLIGVIQSYKADKGFYPQDNPGNPTLSPLFYELTGTTITLAGGAPASYYSSTSGDTLTVAQITTVFGAGPSGTAGFANASADPTQVKNYFASASKAAISGKISASGVTITTLGVKVQGPIQDQIIGGGTINPWSYVSTNPTNNPGSYDLWMDVSYSGKINRISNWSRDPQAQ